MGPRDTFATNPGHETVPGWIIRSSTAGSSTAPVVDINQLFSADTQLGKVSRRPSLSLISAMLKAKNVALTSEGQRDHSEERMTSPGANHGGGFFGVAEANQQKSSLPRTKAENSSNTLNLVPNGFSTSSKSLCLSVTSNDDDHVEGKRNSSLTACDGGDPNAMNEGRKSLRNMTLRKEASVRYLKMSQARANSGDLQELLSEYDSIVD